MTALAILFLSLAPPDRADTLNAVRAEYKTAHEERAAAVRAGKQKDNDEGWAEFSRPFARRVRAVIDADPTDAVALDAILFSLGDLDQSAADPKLFDLLAAHHLASPKVRSVAHYAPDGFLRVAVEKSPHPEMQAFAAYHLADSLVAAGKPAEARPLLDRIRDTTAWAEQGGYGSGTLADTAGRLRFEMDHLSVGQTPPEVVGVDLDDKPLKLSDSRGKVTLVVFWATWCGPCMAMVPHERALVDKYAGRPFAVVGVNGDMLPMPGGVTFHGPDGKPIDDTARVKAAVEKHKITWKSFRSGQHGLAADWNVRSWPTVYLLDARGVIAGKWKGDPGEKELDAAVEAAVVAAEKAGR